MLKHLPTLCTPGFRDVYILCYLGNFEYSANAIAEFVARGQHLTLRTTSSHTKLDQNRPSETCNNHTQAQILLYTPYARLTSPSF